MVPIKTLKAELYLLISSIWGTGKCTDISVDFWCSKNNLPLLNHLHFSLYPKWCPTLSKTGNVHAFYHVTIQVLRDVACHLLRVCNGSLLHN